MRIIHAPQTMNPCYRSARPMKPVGILVHSTGANNKYVRRYVDAPAELGVNALNNHWNKPTANKCMHAFIGLDRDSLPVVAHTLPYSVASWGCGAGRNGSYNRDPVGHIQFEVCEDGLADGTYYREIWALTEDYCVYLCRMHGIPASRIVGHYEAWERGYASNHGDPRHWMRRNGDSMDALRARVGARLAGAILPPGGGGGKMEEVRPLDQDVMYQVVAGQPLMRSDDIKALQAQLVVMGFSLGAKGPDGWYGRDTEAAVRAYQLKNGLVTDGRWKKADQEKLAQLLQALPRAEEADGAEERRKRAIMLLEQAIILLK